MIMKRALLTLSLLLATTLSAQSRDPQAALRNYVAKLMPRCPGGVLTLEPVGSGPANFETHVATIRSSDKYCGTQKYVLYSPKTQQIVVGSIISLPVDGRAANLRITDQASQLLNAPVRATVAPFPLGDGLKAVSIARDTPFGPFNYAAFLDQSEKFLIVGFRSSMTADPLKVVRDALGAGAAVRRGGQAAKVEILELSDFQCPTCARAHSKIEPIIQQNLSRVNYGRLDLPLFENHNWAVPAAMGARAIQRVAPSKYWQYVDHVFKNQEAIGKRNFDEFIREYAEDNDLDWAAMQKIYASPAERKALLEQVSRAFSVGVASTPTFIVNGQVIGFGPEGQFTIDEIKRAIGAVSAPAKSGK